MTFSEFSILIGKPVASYTDLEWEPLIGFLVYKENGYFLDIFLDLGFCHIDEDDEIYGPLYYLDYFCLN